MRVRLHRGMAVPSENNQESAATTDAVRDAASLAGTARAVLAARLHSTADATRLARLRRV